MAQIMNSYCQIRLQLKKVGKIIRPFRYDLNKIPYIYTVDVTNRLKGLDLIECIKNCGQSGDIVLEAVIKTIPKKKNVQTGKMIA